MKLSITAKVIPDFTCSNCGTTQIGTDTSVLHSTTVSEFQLSLDQSLRNPPRAGIPVGWASFGNQGIKCNNCLGE